MRVFFAFVEAVANILDTRTVGVFTAYAVPFVVIAAIIEASVEAGKLKSEIDQYETIDCISFL